MENNPTPTITPTDVLRYQAGDEEVLDVTDADRKRAWDSCMPEHQDYVSPGSIRAYYFSALRQLSSAREELSFTQQTAAMFKELSANREWWVIQWRERAEKAEATLKQLQGAESAEGAWRRGYMHGVSSEAFAIIKEEDFMGPDGKTTIPPYIPPQAENGER